MDSVAKRTRLDAKSQNLSKGLSTKRHRNSQGEVSTNRKSKMPLVEPIATICDSGSYSIKIGNSNTEEATLIPNCIMKAKSERKRLFIGNQIEDCRDLSGLYYLLPCEKGYVTKWDIQKPIWDYVFQNYPLNDRPLLMTQPIFNFKSIQDCIDEIFFEEYEIKSMLRMCPTDLAHYQYITEKGCNTPCLIIDSGYSSTHIVPYIGAKKYYPALKRLFIGGKLLTNYLKDILSYRQLHVMEETYVINQVKEDICFVSQCLKKDMYTAKKNDEQNNILRNYILPDFNNIRRGYVQDLGNKEFPENCQILRLNNERFTVPELLMHPSNIGIQGMGIPEAVAKCIDSCPSKYQQALMENIVLVGGNTHFHGYKDRLYKDIRSLTPCHLRLSIYQPENAICYPWIGGKSLSKCSTFQSMLVSKADYDEYGSKKTYKAFSDWLSADIPQPKIEIKPRKISILDNLKGIDVFGKGGDAVEDKQTESVAPLQKSVSAQCSEPRQSTNLPPTLLHSKEPPNQELQTFSKDTLTVEAKNNLLPITAIKLQNVVNTALKSNVISTVRFIPIGEVFNGNAIITKNVKLT